MNQRNPNRKHSLSALVICCNEADRIEACLQSVAEWADQLVVFDSGSTDGTAEIARMYTDEVHVTDWPGYGPQRQRSLEQATSEYVFTIDADEAVTPELATEIDEILSQDEVPCAVYRMPWIPIVLGKRIKGGRYASAQARLFRREGAEFPSAQVHETLIFPPGEIGILKGGLLHDSYRNYRHMVDKHVEYSWLLAKEKQARGNSAGLVKATVRGWWEFFYQYLVRGMIFDGAHGYLLARILSQYAFHKYAALWSLQMTNTPIDPEFSPEHRQRKNSTEKAASGQGK